MVIMYNNKMMIHHLTVYNSFSIVTLCIVSVFFVQWVCQYAPPTFDH